MSRYDLELIAADYRAAGWDVRLVEIPGGGSVLEASRPVKPAPLFYFNGDSISCCPAEPPSRPANGNASPSLIASGAGCSSSCTAGDADA